MGKRRTQKKDKEYLSYILNFKSLSSLTHGYTRIMSSVIFYSSIFGQIKGKLFLQRDH